MLRELAHGDRSDARGGKLDCQRNSIESPADILYRFRLILEREVAVGRTRPIVEEPNRNLEIERLGTSRLRRLARSMDLVEELKAWQVRKRKYDADPDVKANSSAE